MSNTSVGKNNWAAYPLTFDSCMTWAEHEICNIDNLKMVLIGYSDYGLALGSDPNMKTWIL